MPHDNVSYVNRSEVRTETPGTTEAHPAGGSTAACPYFNAMKRGDAGALRDVAATTMRDNVFGDESYKKAEKVLVGALQMDPADAKGKTNHLLGLCMFHQQRWGDAIKHLEIAVARDPANKDAAKILEKARINAGTNIDKPQMVTRPFTRDELLSAPVTHIREPQNIAPMDTTRRGNRLGVMIQNLTGKVGGAVLEGAITVVDKLRDKDKTFAFESWDSRGDLRGKLELAAMRRHLNEDPLQSTYDKGTLVGFQKPGQEKPEWTNRFRTATGAWTTNNPMEGAAGTEFQRTGAPASERVNRALDPNLPSPREVSRALLQAKGERKTVPFLNNLALAWIQFQTHDWVNHQPSTKPHENGMFKIPLAEDDPLRARYGMDNMYVPATQANPIAQPGKTTYLNEVTHWWDASQIYGSDQQTQDRLRQGANGKTLADGKLRIEGEMLPINGETGVEDTGFSRNWWVGLNLFHTLFVKHHNITCDKLKKAHPDWSSDQIFHTARLINSAVLAKIHTVEWTPAVLPNKKLTGGMATNWWGLVESMMKPFESRKIDNGWEPKHEVLGGIAGNNKAENHGKPYGLSEEFVEVYRLHSGMMDHIDVRPVSAGKTTETLGVDATRGTAARELVEKHGLETLVNSFGHQHMNALVNNNYPEFMTDMSVDGNPVIDLGAVDILRARERGVPPYNEFRRQLGLNPLKSFSELGCSAETVKELERVYGKGIEGLEKMDLLVGTSCELHRPENYGFGETLFQVFIQMASRRLQADPFFTEKLNAKYYSKEGMEIIEHATMKSILLESFPELAKTGLADVNNAFEPWGTNATTNPEEHPLTATSEKYVSTAGRRG
jgi:hypothetical protein